jgi:hypothetical protein
VTVRLAVLQDATDLGAALALAYLSNPLVRWMFEDDLSETRLQRLFTSLVEFGVKNGQVSRRRREALRPSGFRQSQSGARPT